MAQGTTDFFYFSLFRGPYRWNIHHIHSIGSICIWTYWITKIKKIIMPMNNSYSSFVTKTLPFYALKHESWHLKAVDHLILSSSSATLKQTRSVSAFRVITSFTKNLRIQALRPKKISNLTAKHNSQISHLKSYYRGLKRSLGFVGKPIRWLNKNKTVVLQTNRF